MVYTVICTPNNPNIVVTEEQLGDIAKAVLGGRRDVAGAVVDAFPDAAGAALLLIYDDVVDFLAGVST